MEMSGGGVHVDEWTTPPRGGGMFWTYKASDAKPYGKILKSALINGHNGIMPKLAAKPTNVTPEIGIAVFSLIALLASWWDHITTSIKGIFGW